MYDHICDAPNCGITNGCPRGVIYDGNVFIVTQSTGHTEQGILKGKYPWFGINCMTTDNFCLYLQNRLIQTSHTGGQQYSDTSPLSFFLVQAGSGPRPRTREPNLTVLYLRGQ
jgi:hypothetical protein